MKARNKSLTALVLMLLTTLCAKAQIGIGMRDTHFVNVNYTFCRHVNVMFEQSVYYETPKWQYFRLSAAWVDTRGRLSYYLRPYYGMAWNDNYRNLGVHLYAQYRIAGPLILYGMLAPSHDSTFGYQTGYRAGAKVKVNSDLSLVADYNTVPVYRQEERQIRGGLEFEVGRLWFSPMFSMPAAGNEPFKSVRMLCNFRYEF